MSDGYRDQARRLRAAAQVKLAELRAARRGRKAAEPSLAPPRTTDSDPGGEARAACLAGVGNDAGSGRVEAATCQDPSGDDREREASGQAAALSDPISAKSVSGAADSKLQVSAAALDLVRGARSADWAADTSACATAQMAAGSAGPDGAAQMTASAEGATVSEHLRLERLPGLGEGLKRLLGAHGIHDLRDLAAADPMELRTALGLIGELLDLPAWVREAAELAEIDGRNA